MSAPDVTSRTPPSRAQAGGIGAVWAAAAIVAVVIGLLTPPPLRMEWITVGFGVCVLLAFGIQLAQAEVRGFIERMALSTAGALLIMGFVTCGFALAAVVPA